MSGSFEQNNQNEIIIKGLDTAPIFKWGTVVTTVDLENAPNIRKQVKNSALERREC